jgi:hypothetical protein
MNDFPKKIKATPVSLLGGPQVLSEKVPIKLIKIKEPKSEFLKQSDADFAPRQAERDWWWCDDV